MNNLSNIGIVSELNGKFVANQDKDIEIERLQTTCYSLNNKASVAEDQAQEIENLKRRLKEAEAIRAQQQRQIADLEDERKINLKNRTLQEEAIESYETNREEYERRRLQQEKEIATHEKTRAQQRREIEMLMDQNHTLRVDMDECQNQKQKLQRELDQATEYIISMEEKVFKSNKISLELLTQLKDTELELGQVPLIVGDARWRYAYTPISNDAIDVRLSEFINIHPDRPHLKFLFKRVSEGVYEFGQKKVTMKMENNYVKVRTGGGYLTLDEFVEQYLPLELQKVSGYDKFGQIAALEETMRKELKKRIQSSRSKSPSKMNSNSYSRSQIDYV